VILAGDHVYKMDYGEMLAHHVSSDADMTVGCIEVSVADASGFGVMTVDDNDRIVKFNEKPKNPTEIPGKPGRALASMGIYVFNARFLYEQLIRRCRHQEFDSRFRPRHHPLSDRPLPCVCPSFREELCRLQRRCRSLLARCRYHRCLLGRANMEMVSVVPDLDLYDKDWPIWTYQNNCLRPSSSSTTRTGAVWRSIRWCPAAGIISGAQVHHSVLFSDIRIGSRSEITDSVILSGARHRREREAEPSGARQ